MAPGASTLRELFGDEPTLILLDELSIYLRSVHSIPHARGQLTAFLTRLFSAVESTPKAALVYTLAIGKDGQTTDAYSEENKFIADAMEELEEGLRSQGHAPESHPRRGDGPGAAPPPLRGR